MPLFKISCTHPCVYAFFFFYKTCWKSGETEIFQPTTSLLPRCPQQWGRFTPKPGTWNLIQICCMNGRDLSACLNHHLLPVGVCISMKLGSEAEPDLISGTPSWGVGNSSTVLISVLTTAQD